MKQTYGIVVDCPVCAGKMERAAADTPGVQAAAVNFAAQTMAITFADGADPARVMARVVAAVKAVEEDAEILLAPAEQTAGGDRRWAMPLRLGLTVAMTVAVELLPLTGLWKGLLYLLPYLLIGWDILWKAARGLWQRQLLDENFLMAVATVGAYLLGALQTGDYLEAVAVLVLYQLGEALQGYAVGKSRRSVKALLDIRPDHANLERGDRVETVPPQTVAVGSIIRIHPGERVPLDGTVLEGVSTLDTAALTGESLPRAVAAGDTVAGGCINLSGLLRVRTTQPFDRSAASRVLQLVEEAAGNKAKAETFITRFARVYTPLVCAAALGLAVLPPLVRLGLGLAPMWSIWVYRALTALVISCPCALVISVPLTFFAAIGGAGRLGVLVKGANFLEALSRAGCAVMDKTGTLTEGRFSVAAVCPAAGTAEELLTVAALAEQASSHPISRSLLEAYGKPAEPARVSGLQEHSGRGVTALVDGVAVAVGSAALLQQQGVTVPADPVEGTAVYVATDGAYRGCIRLADRLKPTAQEAVEQLRRLGVARTVMLTGDSETAARPVADTLGLELHAGLLPADKVARVEALLQQLPHGRTLLFVGDGINDAPVLARADVGVAMGALGAEAAVEAADVVLMDDDPRRLSAAIRHARRCMAIVRQNVTLSLLVKSACLLLGALGTAPMWLAIFADVGVMLLAVVNALRALRIKE